MKAHPLILLGVSIAAGFIAWHWPNAAEPAPIAEPEPPPAEVTLALENRASQRVFEFLSQRETITAEACLAEIEKWKAQPNALTQQYPIYDAIGRLDRSDLASFTALYFKLERDSFWEEVIGVILYRLAGEQPEQILAVIRSAEPPLPENVLGGLINALLWRSPPNAWALFKALNADNRTVAINYRTWAANIEQSQYPELLDEIRSFHGIDSPAETFEKARRAIASRLWETDKKAFQSLILKIDTADLNQALALAKTISDPQLRDSLVGQLITKSSSSNGLAAVQTALGYFGADKLDSFPLLPHILSKAIEQNSAATVDWLLENYTSEQLVKIASRASRDPKMVPLLARLDDGPEKEMLLFQSLERWSSEDHNASLAWAKDNASDSLNEKLKSQVVRKVAEENMPAAIALLDEIKDPQNRRVGIQNLLSHWPSDDFQEAVNWIKTLDTDQTHAYLSLSNRWAQNDPKQAAAFAASIDSQQVKQTFSHAVAQSLLNRYEPKVAFEYALTMSDATISQNILQQAIRKEAAYDPLSALELARQAGGDESFQQSLHQNTAQAWAQFDAPAAAAYYAARIDDPAYKPSLSQIAQSWHRADPDSAIQWADSLTNGNVRDQTLADLATISSHNPSATADQSQAIADMIRDPAVRDRAIQNIERNRNRRTEAEF